MSKEKLYCKCMTPQFCGKNHYDVDKLNDKANEKFRRDIWNIYTSGLRVLYEKIENLQKEVEELKSKVRGY